jgi:hypothetical protein
MSRNIDQRSSFIAEYAAKRQNQMERAKQLRDQRTGGGGSGGPPTPLAAQSSSSNMYNDQQRYSGSSFDDLPARPQNIKAPSSYAPAPQQQSFTQGQCDDRDVPRSSTDYPPPLRQAQATSYGNSNIMKPSLPTIGTSTLEVTEAHFREATQRGIITPDQARQLWAVLSDQAILIRGNDATNKERPTASRSGAQPQQQQSYNPSQYAAPSAPGKGIGDASNATYRGSYAHQLNALDDDEEYPQMDYGQPSKVSKSLASRVANAKSSSKPEWNNDFVAPGYEEDERQPVREEPSRTNRAPVTKRRQEWNDDTAMHFAEPEPPAAPKANPKPAAVSRSGGRKPGGHEEDAAASLDQAFPSRRKPEQQQKQQEQPQPRMQVPANRHAANASRGGKAPPPPEPSGPIEQDEEEVEEFLRLKEEARRQFEDALADAKGNEPLVPCNICGRNFRASIIRRHEGACKVAGKKRRVFDSKSNRLQGIDGMDEVMQQVPQRKGASKGAPPSRGGGSVAEKPVAANAMPKWKLQHQQFQLALQAIKHTSNPAAAGPPPPMPESLDDRIPCPHCSRRFARETAERHIPSCAKTINKPKGLVRPGGRR